MASRDPVPYPMLLAPRYDPRPWGGRRLEALFDRALPGDGPVGESWEFFDRPCGSSVIVNGALAGRTLAEVRGGKELPLLVKLLDVRQPLSVQVHPTAEAALATETEEKSEAWIVLEADPGARIWRGFKDGVFAADLAAALDRGTVDDVLRSFEPRAGDVVLIPAGMVHAMGGGIVVLEVQQSSETTWRLHDWNRSGPGPDAAPRPLHRDLGLRWALYAAPGPATVEPELLSDDGLLRRDLLADTPQFTVERWTVGGASTVEGLSQDGHRWCVLFCAGGTGRIAAFHREAAPADLRPGATVLVPAALDPFEILPDPGQVLELLVMAPAEA